MKQAEAHHALLHWHRPDFTAAVAEGLLCPSCGKPARPSDIDVEPDSTILFCNRCCRDLVKIEMTREIEDTRPTNTASQ